MATGADEESRSKFTASHFLARAMEGRNPGAPAVKNITNYHAYARAVQSGEVEAVRQALESDPSYMQYDALPSPAAAPGTSRRCAASSIPRTWRVPSRGSWRASSEIGDPSRPYESTS